MNEYTVFLNTFLLSFTLKLYLGQKVLFSFMYFYIIQKSTCVSIWVGWLFLSDGSNRRRHCRHLSSLRHWMGPTSTSVSAARRNVMPARWAAVVGSSVSSLFCHFFGFIYLSMYFLFVSCATGPEIPALSLLADPAAEAFWLWLHHYASYKAEWPHDLPWGAWHEPLHWPWGWGRKRVLISPWLL